MDLDEYDELVDPRYIPKLEEVVVQLSESKGGPSNPKIYSAYSVNMNPSMNLLHDIKCDTLPFSNLFIDALRSFSITSQQNLKDLIKAGRTS